MEKNISINYTQFANSSELNPSDQQLVKAADTILESAYAPYSKFRVGASLLLSNGEVISGSNQENIAYQNLMHQLIHAWPTLMMRGIHRKRIRPTFPFRRPMLNGPRSVRSTGDPLTIQVSSTFDSRPNIIYEG